MKVKDIIFAKVIKINKNHVCIELKNQYKGSVHISNVSDYYIHDLGDIFIIGKEYEFQVIKIDEEKKIIELNWKNIHPRFLKNPFKYKVEETDSGFENLLKKTKEKIDND